MSGVTIAFLKETGTIPSERDIFTNFVMDGAIISMHSFNKVVGQGSRIQDFDGESETVRKSICLESVKMLLFQYIENSLGNNSYCQIPPQTS